MAGRVKAAATKKKRATAARRKPGRPPRKGIELDRLVIIRTAYKLARQTPLQDVSIVVVARALNVTPPLLHYYIAGRDALTSGVMNLFYRDLIRRLKPATGDWEQDLHEMARAIYAHFCDYHGITAYAVSHNRFRILQSTEPGESDYGLLFLDTLSRRVMAAGLGRERTGIYAHILLEYIITSAHGTVSHRLPGEHREFLEQSLINLDPVLFPGIDYTRDAILGFSAQAAFEEGYNLLVGGLVSEAARHPKA